MNNIAAAVYMTSEGVPFMQAGEEMLRSKIKGDGTFDENSYKSSDKVNSLKWDLLKEEEYKNVYEYYKGLIAFRKAHGALRLTTAEEVNANVKPVDGLDANVVAMQINGGVNGETADGIFVIFNANPAETTVTLPEGNWNVCINGETAGTETIETINGTAVVAPISAMVLVQDAEMEVEPSTQPSTDSTEEANAEAGQPAVWPIAAVVAVIVGAVAGVVVYKKKKNK